jgi:hypothetical protein
MVELYGLLSFMYPDVFTTPGPFEAAFNLVKGQVRPEPLRACVRECGAIGFVLYLCVVFAHMHVLMVICT